jgi:hypothetical protein
VAAVDPPHDLAVPVDQLVGQTEDPHLLAGLGQRGQLHEVDAEP